MPNRLTLFYMDTNGYITNRKLWIADDKVFPDDLATLLTDFEAATNAKVYRWAWEQSLPLGDTSAVGPYSSYDQVTLEFRDEEGFIEKVSVPAPVTTYMVNDEKVNPTQDIMSAIIAEIIVVVVTRAGKALLSFIRGYRTKPKRKRKPA